MKDSWHEVSVQPFPKYYFLDQNAEAQYRSEETTAQIFGLFSGLAIAIASMGLFGIASITMAKRAKEFGIRKVMGASSGQIVRSSTAGFLKLVAFSFAIAVPLIWYGMDQWLQNFAYRTPLFVWHFAAAGAIATLIAMTTVMYHSVKAGTANPVLALKDE